MLVLTEPKFFTLTSKSRLLQSQNICNPCGLLPFGSGFKIGLHPFLALVSNRGDVIYEHDGCNDVESLVYALLLRYINAANVSEFRKHVETLLTEGRNVYTNLTSPLCIFTNTDAATQSYLRPILRITTRADGTHHIEPSLEINQRNVLMPALKETFGLEFTFVQILPIDMTQRHEYLNYSLHPNKWSFISEVASRNPPAWVFNAGLIDSVRMSFNIWYGTYVRPDFANPVVNVCLQLNRYMDSIDTNRNRIAFFGAEVLFDMVATQVTSRFVPPDRNKDRGSSRGIQSDGIDHPTRTATFRQHILNDALRHTFRNSNAVFMYLKLGKYGEIRRANDFNSIIVTAAVGSVVSGDAPEYPIARVMVDRSDGATLRLYDGSAYDIVGSDVALGNARDKLTTSYFQPLKLLKPAYIVRGKRKIPIDLLVRRNALCSSSEHMDIACTRAAITAKFNRDPDKMHVNTASPCQRNTDLFGTFFEISHIPDAVMNRAMGKFINSRACASIRYLADSIEEDVTSIGNEILRLVKQGSVLVVGAHKTRDGGGGFTRITAKIRERIKCKYSITETLDTTNVTGVIESDNLEDPIKRVSRLIFRRATRGLTHPAYVEWHENIKADIERIKFPTPPRYTTLKRLISTRVTADELVRISQVLGHNKALLKLKRAHPNLTLPELMKRLSRSTSDLTADPSNGRSVHCMLPFSVTYYLSKFFETINHAHQRSASFDGVDKTEWLTIFKLKSYAIRDQGSLGSYCTQMYDRYLAICQYYASDATFHLLGRRKHKRRIASAYGQFVSALYRYLAAIECPVNWNTYVNRKLINARARKRTENHRYMDKKVKQCDLSFGYGWRAIKSEQKWRAWIFLAIVQQILIKIIEEIDENTKFDESEYVQIKATLVEAYPEIEIRPGFISKAITTKDVVHKLYASI